MLSFMKKKNSLGVTNEKIYMNVKYCRFSREFDKKNCNNVVKTKILTNSQSRLANIDGQWNTLEFQGSVTLADSWKGLLGELQASLGIRRGMGKRNLICIHIRTQLGWHQRCDGNTACHINHCPKVQDVQWQHCMSH